MNRRLESFRNFVLDLESLSKCKERGVAAIITDKDLLQIHSIGINGGAKGQDDCMCDTDGKYGCVHAEINALVKCTTVSEDKIMIVSLAPCKQCAAAIINTPGSFSAVYFIDDWKESIGINMLKNAGIHAASI